MTISARIDDELRARIISTPSVILDDQDVMRALIAANDAALGSNVVDLRGIAMERLETRLDRLEDNHRSVIAAAYENLAGTNQVHRAVLRLLEPADFETFLKSLSGDVADILRVKHVRLVLETAAPEDDPAMQQLDDVLAVAAPGFIDAFIAAGGTSTQKTVTLRQVSEGDPGLYRSEAMHVRSEACLRLDLGTGRKPGLLVLGSEDPQMFTTQQGGDLLAFFAGAFERVLHRWLA